MPEVLGNDVLLRRLRLSRGWYSASRASDESMTMVIRLGMFFFYGVEQIAAGIRRQQRCPKMVAQYMVFGKLDAVAMRYQAVVYDFPRRFMHALVVGDFGGYHV